MQGQLRNAHADAAAVERKAADAASAIALQRDVLAVKVETIEARSKEQQSRIDGMTDL